MKNLIFFVMIILFSVGVFAQSKTQLQQYPLTDSEINAADKMFIRLQVPEEQKDNCVVSSVSVRIAINDMGPAQWTADFGEKKDVPLLDTEKGPMVLLFNRVSVPTNKDDGEALISHSICKNKGIQTHIWVVSFGENQSATAAAAGMPTRYGLAIKDFSEARPLTLAELPTPEDVSVVAGHYKCHGVIQPQTPWSLKQRSSTVPVVVKAVTSSGIKTLIFNEPATAVTLPTTPEGWGKYLEPYQIELTTTPELSEITLNDPKNPSAGKTTQVFRIMSNGGIIFKQDNSDPNAKNSGYVYCSGQGA